MLGYPQRLRGGGPRTSSSSSSMVKNAAYPSRSIVRPVLPRNEHLQRFSTRALKEQTRGSPPSSMDEEDLRVKRTSSTSSSSSGQVEDSVNIFKGTEVFRWVGVRCFPPGIASLWHGHHTSYIKGEKCLNFPPLSCTHTG